MKLNKNHSKSKKPIFFIVLGIISVIWLLLRVIPKPSRINYPCQRMAAANTVAFITWLFGTALSLSLLKKARGKWRESKIPVATMLIIFAIVTGAATLMLTSFDEIRAAFQEKAEIFTPTDLNQPIGTGTGIYPGRVAWAHDSAAVSYNPKVANGFYWDDHNTDPEKVDSMFTYAIDGVTGATRTDYAWDALFRYTNQKLGKPDFGYSPGEKIAIKANLVMGLAGGKDQASCPGPSPQLLMAIIKDLIEEIQVPGEMITVYDVSARIPDYIMKPFKNHINSEFRDVRFVGNPKYNTEGRYISAEADLDVKIHFADTTVADIYLVKSLTEADYFINMGNMKGHTMAGVTFCAKNLYGSVFIPDAVATVNYGDGFGPKNMDEHSGLHKCAAVHDFQDGNVGFFPAREMGTYNYLVDILGHPEIYNKTMLYVIDALYAGKQQNQMDKFATFNDHYTASIFLSQDPIALESVCLDFLRSEPICAINVHGYVDNYLHEAALANDPVSGITYNPGAAETPLQSLGVHEHWNNFQEKQYSRNLGATEGIELVTYIYPYKTEENTTLVKNSNFIESSGNYPNPFSGSTTIEYEVLKPMKIEVVIYDNSGRQVEKLSNKAHLPGVHQLVWNATDIPSGIYHCRFSSSDGLVSTISLIKRAE